MDEQECIKLSKNAKDIAGKRNGKLVAIRYFGKSGTTNVWLCRCDCGNERRLRVYEFSHMKSCGCDVPRMRRRYPNAVRHSKTPTYSSWCSMYHRCINPRSKAYAQYGGRGIKVHELWHPDRYDGFENFLKDMGPRPSLRHSIDRIDNDGNYEPGNCRWATATTQASNRKNNLNLTAFGTTMCISQWAKRVGFSTCCIRHRLKIGMSVEQALTMTTEEALQRRIERNRSERQKGKRHPNMAEVSDARLILRSLMARKDIPIDASKDIVRALILIDSEFALAQTHKN